MRTHSRIIIAHHLILTGYAHWLPNDPRGSGSASIRQPHLKNLGPIHPGRKRIQPPRSELKSFYRQATPLLQFTPLWFDAAKRQAIADAFAQTARDFHYTVYAAAILSNHAHLCVRRHRDDAQTIWDTFADAARRAFLQLPDIPPDHPIWSDRPYKVFLYTPDEVRARVQYIAQNPLREGLPPRQSPWLTPYDGWPHPKPPQ